MNGAKELDNNHSSKIDAKDFKTIANIVVEGRYMKPYIQENVYVDLRVLCNGL